VSSLEHDVPIQQTAKKVKSRRILVTVGTDHHRFDRLIAWFDSWIAGQTVADQIDGFVQRGTSQPGSVDSVDYLEFEQLRECIKAADVVVTHGGPGSIMECRRWGLLPIVCPRDPAHGEHVDDHQLLFSNRLAAQGQILIAHTRAELHAHLDAMTISPRTVPLANDRHVERAVNRVAKIIDRLVGDNEQ
jgi:UDP-N-acetylglucosamine transferase subunit ALG13